MDLNFRTLRADEIDCRIGQIKAADGKNKGGLSLLLYKDARCDMTLLDEHVGPMNWKREHSRDNRNCIVSIWDDEKNQWVSKEDTGTESNTEAEKGLASDSFKRACVNWGIGRELYTAPFIWISDDKCEIKTINGRDGKERLICNDHFYVSDIEYNSKREITKLSVMRRKGPTCVFSFGYSNLSTTDPKTSSAAISVSDKALPKEAPDGYYYCAHCGDVISGVKIGNSRKTPQDVIKRSLEKYGEQLCWPCQKEHEKQTD